MNRKQAPFRARVGQGGPSLFSTVLLSFWLCTAAGSPPLNASASGSQITDNTQCNTWTALGDFYLNAEPGHRDPELAVWWYLAAANLGDAHAQYELAKLFAFGSGTPPDWVVAAKWMSLAARAGSAEAQADLPRLMGKMKPASQGAARELVAGWRHRRLTMPSPLRTSNSGSRAPVQRVGVRIENFPLRAALSMTAISADAYARRESIALVGEDYRAEFDYAQANHGFQVDYTVESLAQWDYFTNFKFHRERRRFTISSSIGDVDYQRLTLANQSSCVYFHQVWASGRADLSPNATFRSSSPVDRVLTGYLCGRPRQLLSDAEITSFFNGLRVDDTNDN